jgi:hypothetical protein
MKPEAHEFLNAFNQAIGEASTPELRESLFRHLGPTWSLYACGGAGDDPKGSALPAFLVEYHDLDGLEKDLGAMVKGINGYFRTKLQDAGDAQRPAIGLERIAGPERGYRLVSPTGLISKLSDKIEPTILIGRSHLALAPSLAEARAALAAESNPAVKWSPAGELARSFDGLPAKLVFLCVGNPRDSFWPEALATFRKSAPEFLGKFLRFDQPGGQPDLLEVLGVPGSARAGLTRAEDLRALIHRSVLAASVEDRTFRVILLEALPLGCFGLETQWSPQGAMNINVKFAPGR